MVTLGLAAALLTGCGGGGQSASEPAAIYKVEISESSFPKVQKLGKPVEMRIGVRNISGKEIPNLAITVDSFTYRTTQPGVADPNRPIWVVEPPAGSEVAQTNTYAFGPLAAGRESVAIWKATPSRSGTYTVKYAVAAGLTGKAKARLADGTAAEGAFVATISRDPKQ